MIIQKKIRHKLYENMQEYESLRNEIISMEEQQRNVWIYMYVLFGALFALGLEWSRYLFLVTYIILIPFQCVINDFLWTVSKISTYIRVFFENEVCGMNWENLHIYNQYQKYYKKRNSSLIGVIRNFGSVHLGIIATGFFCLYTLTEKCNKNNFILDSIDVFSIILSIVLLVLIIKINFDYRKEHCYELEEIIKNYKKEIENKGKSD